MSLMKRASLFLVLFSLFIVCFSMSSMAQKQQSTDKIVKGTDIPFSIKVPSTFTIIYEKNTKDNLYLDFTFENADQTSFYLEGSSMIMRFNEALTSDEYKKAIASFIQGFQKAFKGKDATPANAKPLNFGGYIFNMCIVQEPPVSEADCETNHYFLFSNQNKKIIMFRFSTAAEEEDEAIAAMNNIMKSFKLNK